MPARKPSPSRKPRPAAARRSSVPAAIARGAGAGLAALGRVVAARPLFFAGSAAFLALCGTVGGNALFAQTGGHPQPMLATRAIDPAAVRVVQAPVPTPQAQPWQPTNDPRIMTVPLVRDVQTLLAQTGHYQAEIDGRPGQATDRAIRTFQAERGVAVDGMATTLLLTQIRAAIAAEAAPAEGTQYASLDDLMSDLPTGSVSDGGGERELVRRIQAGLSAASVASLQADGILGERTRAAIRTFQELEGMAVDGEPTPQLLSRLNEITERP
jgi:peptidoglycan hydrolase-like protein with peptidoglycan-binding domain